MFSNIEELINLVEKALIKLPRVAERHNTPTLKIFFENEIHSKIYAHIKHVVVVRLNIFIEFFK